MNNILIYSLIGLILAPSLAALELRVLFFLSKSLKLDVRTNKPIEIISLVIVEVISLLLTLFSAARAFAPFMLVSVIFLIFKIVGLWDMKKWIIYVYVASSLILPFFTSNIQELGVFPTLFSFIGGILILLVYYLYVYKPNKEKFR